MLEAGKEYTASSGVVLRVLPMPYRLLRRYQQYALAQWPDPDPPTREIATVTGPETVDDERDPQFLAAKAEATQRRNEYLSERTLEDCVPLDLTPHEPQIKRLERTTGEAYPADVFERRVKFLSEWVLRTKQDFEAVTALAVGQAVVGDEEVERLLATFRRAMARRSGADAVPPGADEAERVVVPDKDAGA
jgi:hypothetical protein